MAESTDNHPSATEDFVSALQCINTNDPGHRYGDIIESLTEETEYCDGDHFCDYLPFNRVERCVFNCTRRVAEKSLEPESIVPVMVSSRVISMETFEEISNQKDCVEKVHCLMEAIYKNGSRAFGKLVLALQESDDRTANGVGSIMKECLEAQAESPHTPPEWLGKF